jgi:hypothetical protein
MTELKEILKNVPTDTFDADHFAEWFVQGEISVKEAKALRDEQVVEVEENLRSRFSDLAALEFVELVLS